MTNQLQQATEVVKVLRNGGHEGYFVGGCVRDMLLGACPKDYDIVTSARPEEVVKLFPGAQYVGAAFGVVLVRAGTASYEVATYRGDGAYTDGRHPDAVVYGVGKEGDVRRRDFTVNALLLDPLSGEVIDLVGGKADLEARVIRAVGDPSRRFEEDSLRLLRAVRFATRLEFDIERETGKAMRACASKISRVSRERTSVELDGIWASDAARGLELLGDYGLVAGTVPFVVDVTAKVSMLEHLPSGLAKPDLVRVVWAVLLEGLDPYLMREALRMLKRSREDLHVIEALLEAAPFLRAPKRRPLADARRLVSDASWPLTRAFFCALGDISYFAAVERDLAANPLPQRPVVTGADLKALGLLAGPAYKVLLDKVDRAVLERKVTNRAEALVYARALVQSLGD